MDFEKIKAAADEIRLSESEKEAIISSCSGKKRKFNYKPVAAIAAAAAVILIISVSPGFLLKASSPNDSADMLVNNAGADFDYYYTADEAGDIYVNQSASTAKGSAPLFETDSFAEIYAVIPPEFSSLADPEEYAEWSETVSAENGMAMLQFVEHFGITAESFAAANAEYNSRCPAEAQGSNNYFDENVIFSFDRELIDSFYAK